jgi:hypothetical protein
MSKSLICVLALILGLGVFLFQGIYADEGKPKEETKKKEEAKKPSDLSLSDLAMEVQALRLLRMLSFSPTQLKQIDKVVKEAAMPARERKGKASAEYRKVLSNLRDALAQDEEESIDTLSDELDKLTESEKPELDDGIESTEAARKAVPDLLKQLRVTQYVAYVVMVADQVVDPADELKERLDKVRQLSLAEWKEQRSEIVDGVGKLLGGIDTKKVDAIREKVLAVLNQARTLKDEDYQQKKPELEKEIDDLTNDNGPGEIVKHIVELALADLLSNPRLASALEARKASMKEK